MLQHGNKKNTNHISRKNLIAEFAEIEEKTVNARSTCDFASPICAQRFALQHYGSKLRRKRFRARKLDPKWKSVFA
jgi:hypothetical protein